MQQAFTSGPLLYDVVQLATAHISQTILQQQRTMFTMFIPRPVLRTEISPSSPAMPCRAWPLWRMTESSFTGRREQLVTAKHQDQAQGLILIPSVGEKKPVFERIITWL